MLTVEGSKHAGMQHQDSKRMGFTKFADSHFRDTVAEHPIHQRFLVCVSLNHI
jgi:hypothetical protein